MTELNRLLGGDAKCSLYTLNDESFEQTIHPVGTKSVVHLFPISTFPSDWERHQLTTLKQTLEQTGHSVHWIDRPSTTEPWLEVIAQWIRYNVLTQSNEEPVHHILLFIRRELEHWNGLESTADKQRYLLEQELSAFSLLVPSKFLINAPVSQNKLNNIPQTERVLYGFVDSFGQQEDVLHPTLTHADLTALHPPPESISLLRMLRRHIWDSTGCAP